MEGVNAGLSIPELSSLRWLATRSGTDAPDPRALQALGTYLFHGDLAFTATFFAVGSLLFAWPSLRGRMIPRVIAWTGVIASALLVAGLPLQLAGFLDGPITQLMWLPMLVFEAAGGGVVHRQGRCSADAHARFGRVSQPQTKPEILAALESNANAIDSFFSGQPDHVLFTGNSDHWGPAHHLHHLALTSQAVARGLRKSALPPHASGRSRGYGELIAAATNALQSAPKELQIERGSGRGDRPRHDADRPGCGFSIR